MIRIASVGTLAVACALVGAAGCEAEDERAGVSAKLVERADRAAEQTQRTVAERATEDIHEVASEELDHRLYATDTRGDVTERPMDELRQQIDQVHVAQSDYLAARDRVVEQARQHLYELRAHANQPHMTGDRTGLDQLHERAAAALDRLATASAEQWDERSEAAFEAFDRLDQRVGQYQLDARRRARHGPNDPDQRNAPLRP